MWYETLISSFVGGLLVLGSNILFHWYQTRQEKHEKDREIINRKEFAYRMLIFEVEININKLNTIIGMMQHADKEWHGGQLEATEFFKDITVWGKESRLITFESIIFEKYIDIFICDISIIDRLKRFYYWASVQNSSDAITTQRAETMKSLAEEIVKDLQMMI